MKSSDLLVDCLEKEGVKYVFGVPGEENADMMMSLEKSSIDFILTRHEQGAAFMAEVHGRLTGRPAVCLSTLGPGATNLVTGVADANMDRAPVIALTGQGDTGRQHKESHQIMDVVSMFKPITKWSHAITHPDSIPEIICKAVRIASAEKPGVVHLELAEDIASSQTKAIPLQPSTFRRPEPDQITLGLAMKLLLQAANPIIIAGNGAIRERASHALRRLCQQSGIGVMSTFMAKGCVDDQAPYYLYSIGLQQRDYAFYLIEQSDLVITIGYDLVEYPPRLWNPDGQKAIIHIDFLPAEIDRQYQPKVEVIGDICQALESLNRLFKGHQRPAWNNPFQTKIRKKILTDITAYAVDDTTGIIKPQKILSDVKKVLKPKDIVLSGVGAHKMWIGRYLHRKNPNTCIMPNGFCSMGLPLPGAIAAHLVHPDRRILGITGDGDFLMNVQEMETAKRLNSNITILVWQDNAYGLIAWKQQATFGRHTDLSFSNPDWLKLADSFGWHGQYIDKSIQLEAGLRRAFNYSGPSLVVVPVDYRENILLSQHLGDMDIHTVGNSND